MKEIWKDVVGYEGLYQVSNLGNVRRMRFINNTTNKGQIRNMNPWNNGRGYLVVSLMKNGNRKNNYVHRLVAQAFIENPNNCKEINHKDGNKENCCVNNLEWTTRSGNLKHAYRTKLKVGPKSMLGRKGKKHPISKEVKQFSLDGTFIKKYESAKIASDETGVCYMSIKKCRCNNQKTAGGYKWTY